ncbi:hypothetical protein AWC38_SpisGene2088 [Stylophora pistillata]|uniref:Uncharacterized protein n=1 Tax=Stylophora pistillata TaxID=50429 RepID=A0A2B4SV29_STYPI|nr:hypothetical protein AWC38_SpisGene2088 [Stylophora pistillata]
MKEFKENHPEDFQKRNFCIIYFMDELSCSVVERENLDKNAKVMEAITIKQGSKKYNATVMFMDDAVMMNLLKKSCAERHSTLNTAHGFKYEPVAIDRYHRYMHSQTTPGHVFKSGFVVCTNYLILGCSTDGKKSCDAYNSESEGECVEMEENVSLRKAPKRLAGIDLIEEDSDIGEVPFKSSRPTPATLQRPSGNIEAKFDLILSTLDAIERHLSMNTLKGCQGTPPCIKKPKYEIQGGSIVSDFGDASGVGISPTASLMHNEVNLLAIPSGGDLKKYAFKVFLQLFTREEMAAGILEPAREKATGKEVLDPHRTSVLKRAMTEKFGEVPFQKKWGQI